MSSSAVPVVKAKLINLFENEDDLAGIDCLYGLPRDIQRESVIIEGTANWEQKWVGLGASRLRDEEFELTTYITARSPGSTQQEATERAFEIFATVEDVLRTKATADGQITELLWFEIRPKQLTEFQTSDGPAALITVGIECHTRI